MMPSHGLFLCNKNVVNQTLFHIYFENNGRNRTYFFLFLISVKTGMVPFFAMCLEALYVPVEMCKNRHFLKTTMAVSSIIPMKLAQRHLGIIAITMG